jgi:hypothetical protein
MARYEATVHGSIDELKQYIDHNKSRFGITLSTEEETEGEVDGIRYYAAGLERYAWLGQNRVSLNVVMLQYSEGVRVIATALGGSQAAFVKINHWSEDNFLNDFVSVLEEYERKKKQD